MASYAQELKYRVVLPNPRAYGTKRTGRYCFRTMHDNDNEIIGNEMAEWQGHHMSQTPQEAEQRWIFRDYLDGTAFFRWTRFRSNIRRRSVYEPVWHLVEKHYHIDTTIEGDWDKEIIVLRRKPLSDYSKLMANAEANLGDYLVQKYNINTQ